MKNDLVYFSFYILFPFIAMLRLIWFLCLAYIHVSRRKSKITLMKW
jgi:hypothetical protein